MKASEINFLKFLQGTKQFIIPIYQRKYSWDSQQCQQLWADLENAATNQKIKGHFMGSIVYIEKGLYQISAVPKLLVIDGQQRLTTLTLLLLAFRQIIDEGKESVDITSKKIHNYYLVNNEEEGDLYPKLILSQSDRESLVNLVNHNDIQKDSSPKILDNYEFFLNKIRNSELSLNQIYEGLQKFIIVDISLDRDNDNPQLIFESLNSTGLDLSQADLIRNYILMRLEPQEQNRLYQKYWHPMEKSFGNLNESTLFDRFMRDYLTLKTGYIPRIKEVYKDFKEYLNDHSQMGIEHVLEDIVQYSKYFVYLTFNQEPDQKINEALKDISELNVEVSYPFLMSIYDDFSRNKLSREEFILVLRMVESYIFRRTIVGIPTNSMNKTFASLKNEIVAENYLESLEAAFVKKGTYQRMPNNEEFKLSLMIKDVYNYRNRNYLLRKLENFKRKEVVNIETFTIEHIMPQNENLSIEWQQNLGPSWKEVQEKYLHTVGNLTLTAYNSELSDRPFIKKRDLEGGFADSPLRLNRELGKLDSWNEILIQERAEGLSKKALLIWTFPDLSPEILGKYKEQKPNKEKKHDNRLVLKEYYVEALKILAADDKVIFHEGPSIKTLIRFKTAKSQRLFPDTEKQGGWENNSSHFFEIDNRSLELKGTAKIQLAFSGHALPVERKIELTQLLTNVNEEKRRKNWKWWASKQTFELKGITNDLMEEIIAANNDDDDETRMKLVNRLVQNIESILPQINVYLDVFPRE